MSHQECPHSSTFASVPAARAMNIRCKQIHYKSLFCRFWKIFSSTLLDGCRARSPSGCSHLYAIQGCRCDGKTLQGVHNIGLQPGALAAGASHPPHSVSVSVGIMVVRIFRYLSGPSIITSSGYHESEVHLLRHQPCNVIASGNKPAVVPRAATVYINAACNFTQNYDTAPAVCPVEPPVPAAAVPGGN